MRTAKFSITDSFLNLQKRYKKNWKNTINYYYVCQDDHNCKKGVYISQSKKYSNQIELYLCISEEHNHTIKKGLPKDTKSFIYKLLTFNITNNKAIEKAILQENLTSISLRQLGSLKQSYKKKPKIKL